MESVGSNSSPSSSSADSHDRHGHRLHLRLKPGRQVAERISRAIRQPLHLLHRSEASFYILGSTGNVYTVTLNATPTCSCPDRTRPCKHILFVLIRVLGVSLDDACLRRRNLRICQLNRLLGTATLPEALAGVCVRERFHQMFFQRRYGVLRPRVEVEDGTTCPICLEEMEKGEKVVACGSCRNTVHEECLMRWKRSKGRRAASCVICRARWRDRNDEDKYLNLAAYAGGDDTAGDGVGICAG
uniref:SWIM-type domain-containing protein n=1 Tax=Salix viminalis TaxID=40686 RepID=A0A6N2KZU2_SALVM